MLQISIPATELFDESQNLFMTTKEQVLQLEHSLVSLAKWESKHLKPFMTKEKKSFEETIDYIRCMTITQNVDPGIYNLITNDIVKEVNAYIEAPMTATTFGKSNRPPSREIITAEIIYYWMVSLSIPFECQKWHLNRLLTLINVCNVKNQPKKNMPVNEVYARNRSLNAARKHALNSSG